MNSEQGIFIVLEGVDGSGKGTQFRLLTERLKAVGYDVEVFDFPRYEQPSSHFVRNYLNGEYGDAAGISPYTASLFFALDRYEAAPQIKKAIQQGKIVLSNRYVGSNMAHQGGKFTNSGEQRGFFIWEDGLEFQMLGIPRPTLNIFLRVPAEISHELIVKKAKRSYTDNSHDQHEADIEHLKHCRYQRYAVGTN
jgi:dTMP kinase